MSFWGTWYLIYIYIFGCFWGNYITFYLGKATCAPFFGFSPNTQFAGAVRCGSCSWHLQPVRLENREVSPFWVSNTNRCCWWGKAVMNFEIWQKPSINNHGGLFIYFVFVFCFFAVGFGFFFWFLVLCFPVSLIFCFSASLLFCFSAFPASLLFCFSAFCFPCFSAFPASLLFCFLLFLLLCFSASLFSPLLCFCTSVPFYFYYSTFSFLQSCVFAAPLPAPLLLCFLSLLSLCFSFSFALFCSVCILNETLERP